MGWTQTETRVSFERFGEVMKYRKKPVVIEAIQYRGHSNYDEICALVGQELVMEYCNEADFPDGQNIIIPTLEGEMNANKGDYIIKGIAGEFYPCKPDIFKATYEVVE